ncbi:hypothetical protein CFB46_22790 [Burkholderia sp. HI2761]|nr:hypothetical protein CFB46_22790 [Burkholderia sp. HI2761]
MPRWRAGGPARCHVTIALGVIAPLRAALLPVFGLSSRMVRKRRRLDVRVDLSGIRIRPQ